MDYNLAALKLFCGQLKDARETSSPSAMTFRGILFQRAWLQGVLVSCGNNAGHFVLDDGTGVIDIFVMNAQHEWKIGMYVMVVGAFILRIGEAPMIKVHKIVDLSGFPDREAMWYIEVAEANKLFYASSFEE